VTIFKNYQRINLPCSTAETGQLLAYTTPFSIPTVIQIDLTLVCSTAAVTGLWFSLLAYINFNHQLVKLDADCADEVFVRRVNLEAQNAREKLEADEFDDTWNRVSAGTFVMNIQRE